MNAVGISLKSLRESVGLSQKRIAELLEGTQSSINRYESGKAEAPYKILLWYSDYFDVSMDYLFGRTENPEGKLYNYKPEALKEKAEEDERLHDFVEMCFEPDSPISRKLKDNLFKMLSEERQ